MEWINKQIVMKKFFLKIISLSLCLFYGCSNTDDKLNKYIESHCTFNGSDTCYIDIKDALKVDYDKMYLFGETTTADEISKIIGISYTNNKYISDSKYRMILLKNDKIVYEDDYYQNHTEFIRLNPIKEALPLTCYLYTIPFFLVEKRASQYGKYPYFYLLKPIEE